MRKQSNYRITLSKPATYQIKVPGVLDESWSDWEGEITIIGEKDDDGLPATTLTGTFDQAALQGLLRHLYSMGLPLISVQVIRNLVE